MDSMIINGYPWISIDSLHINRYPWISMISMHINGYPWISMDFHGYPLISMDSMDIYIYMYWYPWISIETHDIRGYQRISTDICGYPGMTGQIPGLLSHSHKSWRVVTKPPHLAALSHACCAQLVISVKLALRLQSISTASWQLHWPHCVRNNYTVGHVSFCRGLCTPWAWLS